MVNIQPQSQQSMSDDQELAKVLAGVNQQADDNSMQFEETPVPTPQMPAAPAANDDQAAQPQQETPAAAEQPAETAPAETPAAMSQPSAPAQGSSDLDPIKNEAINELRPLVDKLTLAPEEKFDTYLLLLRSTDDRTLIAPAHTAAQAITDESRKAQALLDIIKEIDYLSGAQQNN